MAELLSLHVQVPYLFNYETGFPISRMTTNN